MDSEISIKSSAKSIDECFDQCLYEVPGFQRPYSWNDEQLQDFWVDIEVFSPDAFVEGEDDQGCGGDRGDGSGIEGDVREGLEVLDQGVGPLGGSPH